MAMPVTDVSVGDELELWVYHVAREDLVRYAQASGDDNPIHQNEEFAKAVGLPDIIAHGMHTMAKMGQYVTDWAGDPGAVTRIKCRFTKPVVVPKNGGNEVTVSGKISSLEGTTAVVEISAAVQGGEVVAQATATVRLA